MPRPLVADDPLVGKQIGGVNVFGGGLALYAPGKKLVGGLVPKIGTDFEEAFRVNGDGVGFVLNHCRSAKAALYMSSSVIYSMHEDPWHEQRETDPIGWAKPGFSATANVSKIAGIEARRM